jgi:hypothetical protein
MQGYRIKHQMRDLAAEQRREELERWNEEMGGTRMLGTVIIVCCVVLAGLLVYYMPAIIGWMAR